MFLSTITLDERAIMRKLLVLVFSLLSFGLAMAAVNLNTASKQELESLNGIGPAKAQAIIDYRTKNGGFKTIDDLKNVPGIGEKTFEKLKSEIAVGGKPATIPAKATTAAPGSKSAAPPPAKKPAQ